MVRTQQRGFAIIEIVLVVVLLAIIAFVAWRVIIASGDVENAQNQVPTSTGVPANGVPAATNAQDLSKLEQQLNSANIDDSTSADLDAQTDF